MPAQEKATPDARARARHRKYTLRRLPTKRSINLAAVGFSPIRWPVAIPAIALILIAAALFGKFFVADRLQAVSRARQETATVQRQLDEAYARLDRLGELAGVYAHYTYSGMTAEELGRVDRVAVMELLERVVMPRTPLDTWLLTGNALTLDIQGSDLQEINQTVQLLSDDPLVDYCRVNNATTHVAQTAQTLEGESVTANVVVYLKSNAQAGETGDTGP